MPRIELIIDLPRPCDEPWEAMQPVPGGRHCNSCAKTVVDLSSHTDAHLIAFFSRKNAAGTCCRLRGDQLNRTIQEPPERIAGLRIWQRAAALLLAAQLLVSESVAQTTKRVQQTVRPTAAAQKPAQRYLKARIAGLPPQAATGQLSIRIGDAPALTITPDSHGRFRLPLPPVSIPESSSGTFRTLPAESSSTTSQHSIPNCCRRDCCCAG